MFEGRTMPDPTGKENQDQKNLPKLRRRNHDSPKKRKFLKKKAKGTKRTSKLNIKCCSGDNRGEGEAMICGERLFQLKAN